MSPLPRSTQTLAILLLQLLQAPINLLLWPVGWRLFLEYAFIDWLYTRKKR